MQIINDKTPNNYTISIVPRYFEYDVYGIIRCKIDNTSTNHDFTCDIINGVMVLNLGDFIPNPETKYELTLTGRTAGLMWLGQIMLTNKDVQNYQMNATDENNLKF